jgi:ATP-dependent RNA helicase DeaD
VGAIANEADIESQYIGQIDIKEKATFVDLPAGLPKEVIELLQKTVVCGQRLNLKKVDASSKPSRSGPRPPRSGGSRKPRSNKS